MRIRTDLVLHRALTWVPFSWKFRKTASGVTIRRWFLRLIGSRLTTPGGIEFPLFRR